MLFHQSLYRLAVAASAGSLLLAVLGSTALAQRPVYRTASHGNAARTQSIHDCCPSPCPGGVYSDGTAVEPGAEPEIAGEDLPEVADFNDSGDFASAPQSAVPNAIGDSLGGCFIVGDPSEPDFVTACPGGGRRFRIAENNSALPQHRVYYNYHYFHNALPVENNDGFQRLNVRRHEFGFEHAFWCNMASFGMEVPFSHTLASTIDTNLSPYDFLDTELGNVSLFGKRVIAQDACRTVTFGLGLVIPTAQDSLFINLDGEDYFISNDTVTLSPYVAMLRSDPCGNTFLHGFVQLDIPLNDNSVTVTDDNPVATETFGIRDEVVLYVDASLGYWLSRDCCGNGIAAIAEIHYSEGLSGDRAFQSVVGNDVVRTSLSQLNATVGTTIIRGCWDVTPAVVLPLLDRPDRTFDWEFALNVNRRF